MSNKGKAGRPRGSTGPNPLGLISVAYGDQSSGVSRTGLMYGMHGSFSMRPEEIEEMKARRAAEIAQAEKDDRDARFEQALAAVASRELNIYQASLKFNVNRITLTAHAAAGKQAPKAGRPPVMTEEQVQDIVEIVKD
jgi:hypothetical protein